LVLTVSDIEYRPTFFLWAGEEEEKSRERQRERKGVESVRESEREIAID
jgi:hypothetical protein